MTRNTSLITLALCGALASCSTVEKPVERPAKVVQVIYPYKYKGEKCFTRFIEDVPTDEVCVKKDIVSYNPAPVAYYSHVDEFPDYVRALFAAAKIDQPLPERKEEVAEPIKRTAEPGKPEVVLIGSSSQTSNGASAL